LRAWCKECEDWHNYDEDDIKVLWMKCCACGNPIIDGGLNINLINLQYKAKWNYPCWGDIPLKLPSLGAVAIICDKCLKRKKPAKYAIKWNENRENVEYIPITELERLISYII